MEVEVEVGVRVTVLVAVNVDVEVAVEVRVAVAVALGVAVLVEVEVLVGVEVGPLWACTTNCGGLEPSFDEKSAPSEDVEETLRLYVPAPVIIEVRSISYHVLTCTAPREASKVVSAAGALFQTTVFSCQELSLTR